MVPSWSKDGRWIYFASNRTGRPEVWKVPFAGGDSIQITKRGGFAAFESSDGQYVYYAKGVETDGVWKVAVSGGEEAEVIGFPKAGFWGYWALVDAGMLLRGHRQPSAARSEIPELCPEPGGACCCTRTGTACRSSRGLLRSPHWRWILYTQEDHRSGDISCRGKNFHELFHLRPMHRGGIFFAFAQFTRWVIRRFTIKASRLRGLSRALGYLAYDSFYYRGWTQPFLIGP